MGAANDRLIKIIYEGHARKPLVLAWGNSNEKDVLILLQIHEEDVKHALELKLILFNG